MECICGTCQDCIDRENNKTVEDFGYKITTKVQERLLAKVLEPQLKRAVIEAIGEMKILESCSEETVAFLSIKHETIMRLISDATSVRKIKKIQKINTDPKSVAEFKESLRKLHEERNAKKSGKKKAPKHDTNGQLNEPKIKEGAIYKTDDPKEKSLMKAILSVVNNNMWSYAKSSIVTAHGEDVVRNICKKMNVEF